MTFFAPKIVIVFLIAFSFQISFLIYLKTSLHARMLTNAFLTFQNTILWFKSPVIHQASYEYLNKDS